MTKSKTSTIAIVVLSVLLAAALAATIVLAAFTATGRASTTITFGEGLTVTLSGDDVQTAGNTVELTPKSGLTDTGDIYSNALTATPSRTAHIAYKPAITVSEGFTAGAATNGTNAVTWTITKGSDTITLTMAYTGATWNTESSC